GAEAAREVAAAMRDEARLALDRSEVRAPRAGTVMQRLAAPGSRVDDEGEPLLRLYDPASLQVRCDVPLRDAARLSVGLEAEIRVDALPERIFRGSVERIVPQGDIQKNTVQCKVSVESPDPALRPDMLARVRILARGAASRGEAVAVPAEALRSRDGDRATVLVAAPDGTAARATTRAVTLGVARANGWIEVADGLAAGDRVVLDAALAEGARFAPVERPKEEAP
ncbi:MAG: p-hydroxybenzoic acid efflux pump subunit AaeA, partial [Planctomycetota bacterium]